MANQKTTLDSVFRALSDPTRRAVIQQLGRNAATISELAKPFDIALPSFLKHIGVLEDAGLIATKKHGRIRTCRLRHKRLATAERWFVQQRALWQSRFDNLDDVLMTMTGED